MEKHPGGIDMTHRLLTLGGLSGVSPCSGRPLRILDMGAGDGHSVCFLRQLGFEAVGIDKEPGIEGTSVISGDFLRCPFPDQSFDTVLSECSFYISGSPSSAVQEAFRLLKKGGLLLLADISYSPVEEHKQLLISAGFRICALEDITECWKEYYISCIWNGTADLLCPKLEKGKCFYYLTVCERM